MSKYRNANEYTLHIGHVWTQRQMTNYDRWTFGKHIKREHEKRQCQSSGPMETWGCAIQ